MMRSLTLEGTLIGLRLPVSATAEMFKSAEGHHTWGQTGRTSRESPQQDARQFSKHSVHNSLPSGRNLLHKARWLYAHPF